MPAELLQDQEGLQPAVLTHPEIPGILRSHLGPVLVRLPFARPSFSAATGTMGDGALARLSSP